MMTGEIVQSILGIEKKAEKIVSDAKDLAQYLTLETDKKIKTIQSELKEQKKELLLNSKSEIEKKAEQRAKKVAEKTEKDIAVLSEIAAKNAASVKKFVLEKLIS